MARRASEDIKKRKEKRGAKELCKGGGEGYPPGSRRYL